MLCIGSSVGVIIAGRILQGTSAAVVWTCGLALLADTVGQEDVGQAMGYVGLAMSLGLLVGPLLGGVVFARSISPAKLARRIDLIGSRAGYYSVFGMAFGLIGLDIVLRVVLIEKKAARKWIEVDEVHSLQGHLAAHGAEMELPARQLHSHSKRDDAATNSSQALGIPTEDGGTSAGRQNRLPPIITLLGSRRLLAGLWACLVQASLLTSFDATLPLFVHNTFGWSSTGAGLIFLAIVIPSSVGPFVGILSDRYGPRWFAALGFLLTTPFLVLLRYVTHNSLNQKVLLCALLFFIGLCDTLVFAPITAEITYVVEAKERKRPGLYGTNGAMAQAYGLFNMAWAGGCLVGPIWAGMVNETVGWGTMAWTLGLLSFVTAFPTAIWTGGLITRPVHSRHAAAPDPSPSP